MSKLDSAPTAYSFDDFLLDPVFSTISSRKQPDVSVNLSKNFDYLWMPIIASCMNTVTDVNMMVLMSLNGGTSILHRYMTLEDQIKKYGEFRDKTGRHAFVAVGATGDYLDRAKALVGAGVKGICVDVANGFSQSCSNAVYDIRNKINGDFTLMAGNVCSYEGTLMLCEAGAELIRVGVGPGAACITRKVSGHGIPQLTALEESTRVKEKFPNCKIISDGGIRDSGDLVKALAIGADAVIVGSLLAGTTESPGDVVKDENGEMYKFYNGMASAEGRSEWFDREKTSFVPEGVSMKIRYKGSALDVLNSLVGGLKVGMSYCNARNLQELRQNARWVKVTPAGIVESGAHGKSRSL